MEGIMVKVNELFDMLVAKNGEADALSKKQSIITKEQETTAKAQAEKGEELRLLGEKHAKIEDIVKVKRDGDETLQKIMQTRESLAVATSAHNQQAAKDKQDIVIREQGIKDDFKTLKEGQAKLAEDQKQLAEDRENMKKEIIEKIAKGIK